MSTPGAVVGRPAPPQERGLVAEIPGPRSRELLVPARGAGTAVPGPGSPHVGGLVGGGAAASEPTRRIAAAAGRARPATAHPRHVR
ncbi:hypothetical protein [Umezawaea beigongshangensis]|uniref:hypothetical protein n=1 Tax=Umezawaea beigongshangensis TaxID=2780383 RepID=UPI0018F18555|nr:hypothetical protein [Umezawaea beigongshangensis]